MDPTLYNAVKRGDIGDGCDFRLADHLKRDEENGYQVTSRGNTVLHVASLYGHFHFVEEILKIAPALICCQNKKNETALHVAANEGHAEVVRALLACVEKEELVRTTDARGDTALHKAVRSQHLDVVKLLVKEDPEFEFPANHAHETPLYLAAESGFHDALITIFESCKKPTYAAGPSNRTPLHAAIIQQHKDCARSIWQRNKPLCEELDIWGWNSLHYAVKLGLEDVVSDMLGWKKSLAYTQAGDGNCWTTAIHIAADEGDVNMIKLLLDQCPDCWDMLNSNSQNVLHAAILSGEYSVVRSLLKSEKWDSLVDEPDNDGNTPLHLFAASIRLDLLADYENDVPELINHPRAKKMSFNKSNQTPLDIALSVVETMVKDKLEDSFRNIGKLGKRDFEPKVKYQYRLRTDQDEYMQNSQSNAENILKSTQTDIVLAALIMTVTFTASFTLPGGFESDPDKPNQGMAILIRKAAFRAFVVSDAIAFTCSAVAISIYSLMSDKITSSTIRSIFKLYSMDHKASIFQFLSMVAVVIAFVTGMFVTLEHSLGLAVTVCFIGCLYFVMYFWSFWTS